MLGVTETLNMAFCLLYSVVYLFMGKKIVWPSEMLHFEVPSGYVKITIENGHV